MNFLDSFHLFICTVFFSFLCNNKKKKKKESQQQQQVKRKKKENIRFYALEKKKEDLKLHGQFVHTKPKVK